MTASIAQSAGVPLDHSCRWASETCPIKVSQLEAVGPRRFTNMTSKDKDPAEVRRPMSNPIFVAKI